MNLAGVGCTQEEILFCVPWGLPNDRHPTEKTLRKHFRAELDRGHALSGMQLKKRAYDMAVGGDKTMLIFVLKTQFGWRETVAVENSGPNGAPLPAGAVVQFYLPAKDARQEEEPAPAAAPQSSSDNPSPRNR